ncbi:MAG TPA: hypothetical protein VK525_02735 [Candidatus Saccharimonadales bacterium]|nr:hypothetical protein [Candidatus Saccharimonadales bacterium]
MIELHVQALLGSQTRQKLERIVIKKGEHYEFVPVDSIEWIESANTTMSNSIAAPGLIS